MNYSKKILKTIIICFVFSNNSCKKEDAVNSSSEMIYVRNGVLISNEGNYTASDGSVSYFSIPNKKITQDVFTAVNHIPLGSVVQSMALMNESIFIVVNNSQKIEVVDRDYFKSKGTITGFSGPRYFLPVAANKAYVSDWFANEIKIVNPDAMTITGSITTGAGPEQMLLLNSKVYVTNIGGWGTDSTVTIINAVTDQVISTLMVGINPGNIVADSNQKVWILCNGTLGPDFTPNTSDDIGGN